MLKVNGDLCAPFNMNCSLSGMLYTLAIEPLLCKIGRNISGLSVPKYNTLFCASVYADDIVVMVNGQRDV